MVTHEEELKTLTLEELIIRNETARSALIWMYLLYPQAGKLRSMVN
jgi:hypothetical protein